MKRVVASSVLLWLVLLSPVTAFAQEAVDAVGNPTGAPACTGASCDQGKDQGLNQGTGQGGVGATLGEDGSWVYPEGTVNTTQGSQQGSTNGISGTNSTTGANSTNTVQSEATTTTATGVNNTVTDATNGTAAATTGANTQNQNTGAGGVTTGAAGIGVTQVKQDNTAMIGGSSGLSVTGHTGDYTGDLNLGFGAGTANLQGANGPTSIRAINDTTGSGSTNTVDIATKTEELNEVQNDGVIRNLLDLQALTGQNEASQNTSDGSITTGDADVAATLVNLLNTTVINGSLWLTVADIFGDLNGNIILPDLAALAAALSPVGTTINVGNDTTGADSTNEIDVTLRDTEETTIVNDADITTTVNAQAITGQNEALANTGGGSIETGDASVSASALTLANTTIEGGNWGLVVVNALNRWLGFLVGDAGQVIALSQEETIREIEARNGTTGENSTNTIAVTDEHERVTNVENDATIINEINASAITGQNEASMNTGQGQIVTGDASVKATTVNIANTTVKDASLFIAVVNIFGDWFGDLLYGGNSLLRQGYEGQGSVGAVAVNAENSTTGSGSTNDINVDASQTKETIIDNDATVKTTLNAEVDTGSNKTNKNTLGASIKTGEGSLALNARTLANLTGIALDPVLGLQVDGLNDTTGFDSTNKIRATLNDERVVTVNNDANVSTAFGGGANTGKNEANMNTLGGMIVTGDIAANAEIGNIINKIILALAQGGQLDASVEADLRNHLTGMLSENSNDVAATYTLLADILNKGVVDNLIDLLLNTGGNTANENTGGGAIATGTICVAAGISNSVNSVNYPSGVSLQLENNGQVNNQASINATTGTNQVANNTDGGTVAGSEEDCKPKLAEAQPEPTPVATTPPVESKPEGQGGGDEGGQGGGEAEQIAELKPAVLAAKSEPKEPRVGNGILTRFPVAGGEATGVWLEGKTPLVWPLFLLLSIMGLGAAWVLDRRARGSLIIPYATL